MDVSLVILCFLSSSLCRFLENVSLAVQVRLPDLKHILAPLKDSVCFVFAGVTFAAILELLDIQVFPVVVITSLNHLLQSLRTNFDLFFFFKLYFNGRLRNLLLNFWFLNLYSFGFVSMFILFKFIMLLLGGF